MGGKFVKFYPNNSIEMQNFQIRFGKKYPSDAAKAVARQNFKDNILKISENNRNLVAGGAEYRIDYTADMDQKKDYVVKARMTGGLRMN